MYNLKEKNGLTINKPDAGEKTLFLDLDGKVKTKDENGDIEEISIANPNAPKVYKALLTQTGTSAPVATVLENTLGGTVVWTRNGPGQYTGTLSGVFTNNKTCIFIQGSNDGDTSSATIYDRAYRSSVNEITLVTVSLDPISNADSIMNGTSLLIEVYP